MANNKNNRDNFLFTNEPVRFTKENMDQMLIYCTQQNASDITIQTGVVIFADIYGRLRPITKRKLTNSEVGDMLNYIYGANGTTQIYSGKDVDTHYEIRPDRGQRLRFRVNGTGCQVEGQHGIQITLRTIPTTPPKIEDLNLEPEIIKNMTPEQGTIIITGPTGSGKSTLLAAIIRHIAEDPESHRKMLTYESPIEFVYDMLELKTCSIAQSEIPKNLASFAAGVRNALRRKPGLILVGEARDQETISAVIDAALTGHPVYSTLHSNGVADAVRRMISTFPADERNGRALDILETMRMVVWQKLAKSTDGKRIALREFLVFDDEVRDILIETEIELLAARTRLLLRERGQPIIVDAKQKYEDGLLNKRDYDLLLARSKMMDKDAGVIDF